MKYPNKGVTVKNGVASKLKTIDAYSITCEIVASWLPLI